MQKNDITLNDFLKPTLFIESTHPDIISAAAKITSMAKTDVEKAEKIFYFMRDEIRYEFRAKFHEEQYHASYIVKDKKGFCTQKAILFCALARSVGIPAGIYFYDIVDHSLPEHTIQFMRTRTLYHHGIAALFLNNRWCQLDATLDSRLVKRNNLYPVEFQPDQDCLMRPDTPDGRRHIEYIKDYGMVNDVTFNEIASWFMRGYPHLVEKYTAGKEL